ncbi:TetR/AcrR family transcriptional regulator [Amycolatopsis benzoatilytica]|uniref:TetR/AcrR family transcriptional regulator n=1 Tax=Amycolatopsis benzoatilytica TaxID=346045 RepID=UPI0003685C48|nr:TetR/AcrR family transcriptional regulator [Amycolatopsis benzoatilytica]
MSGTSPRRAPRERQRDPERTKARILAAAKAEFGSKGYAAARVSEIARGAGVNKQLISYYFGGKEGLYAEVTSEQFSGLAAMTVTDRPMADVVADFARDGLRDPDQARLFLRENMAEEAGGETGTPPERAFLHSQLDYLRARQEAGDFPADVDPQALLLMLIAAASAPVAFRRVGSVLTGQDPASAEFVEYYAEQLSRMVRHLKD